MAHVHAPSKFDKMLLVWVKRYASINEVPNTVRFKVMQTARDRARIKCMWWALAVTISSCGLMMVSGRRAMEQGDSVEKRNLMWHKVYNETNEIKSNNIFTSPETLGMKKTKDGYKTDL